MISPHTPPGTKVVCIDASTHGKRFYAVINPVAGDLDGLVEGAAYTVDRIDRLPEAKAGFVVVLCEITRRRQAGVDVHVDGFALNRFRYLDLPKSITSCLTSQPLLVEETV